MKIKYCVRILWIIPFVLFSNAFWLLSEKNNIRWAESLSNLLAGQLTMDGGSVLVLALENIGFLILYAVLMGNYMYEDFEYGAVYRFSRTRRRERWFFQKIAEMLLITILYITLYVVSMTFLAYERTEAPEPGGLAKVIVLSIMGMTFISFIGVLWLNVFSIQHGVVASNGIFYTMLVILCVGITHFRTDSMIWNLNPLSIINVIHLEGWRMVLKIVYLVILTVMVIMWGEYRIEKMDIALKGVE